MVWLICGGIALAIIIVAIGAWAVVVLLAEADQDAIDDDLLDDFAGAHEGTW